MSRIEHFALNRKGPCIANNIAGSCKCGKCRQLREMFRHTQAIPHAIAQLEHQNS